MMISPSTIQLIQRTARIEEVIADFVPLKKKGQNFWTCCPFHHEQTASFSVSPIKGFYKCFGCDAAGDVITFIQQIEGISFVEALTYLAQKYAIPLTPAQDGRDLQDYRAKESLYMLLSLAKGYYTELLWQHTEAAKVALPYLEQRAISFVIAKKFGLGYSLDRWDGFYSFALSKGISLALLIEAGLVIKNGDKIYDRFRGRLMFPIHNSTGQVVAFGARHMATGVDGPKYINSSETPVYQKGSLLYGLSFAKPSIKQTNHCYLVEGYTDVLAFHRAGVEQVVASAGTALTEAQIDGLRRLTTKVTLVFDGDQAGIQAAFRGIDKLLAQGLEVKVVLLPSGEDPDSYLRKVGIDAFNHYIHCTAQDFVTFKASLLCNQSTEQNPVEQAKAIRAVVQSIVAIPDEITRTLFLKKCSQLFAIEERVLFSTYHALQHQNRPTGPQKKSLPKYHRTPKSDPYVDRKNIPFISKLTASIQAYEREIMRILLTYGRATGAEEKPLYAYILSELEDVNFRSSDCKILFDYCQSVFKQGGSVDMQCCLDSREATIRKIAINVAAFPHDISEAWIKKYSIYTTGEAQNVYQVSLEVILRLKIRLVQELIEQNRAALQKELSADEETHLLKVHQSLKDTECQIAKQLGTVVAQ